MKHSWKAPPWAQSLSYRVLPSRRKILNVMGRLESMSMDLNQTHQHVRRLIDSGQPFLLGRPGGTESEGLHHFLKHRIHSRNKSPQLYPSRYKYLIHRDSGVASTSEKELDFFHLEYLRATLACDLAGFGLFAPGALSTIEVLGSADAKVTPIENLEPFLAYSEGVVPWTKSLAGKRVLVIHPFGKSITQQFSRRKSISAVSEVMPEFELQVLQPPFTYAIAQSENTWAGHFADLVTRTLSLNFEIALVAAGSYGLPIAHEIRKEGRQAIHLGGSLQLLFGIRGRRWEGLSPFKEYMDQTWVRPSPSEVPRGFENVEGGAYW